MNRLPPEILLAILEYTVASLYSNKNRLLALRTTCKLFDEVLKPYALRTLQLEFTRLDKVERALKPPDDDALRRVGHMCRALYLDMMVVRDEGEIGYLDQMFRPVRTMDSFVADLRNRYCMSESSFTEIDYRRRVGTMLEHTPKVSAVKLTLPLQLVSSGQYGAATLILGNSFEALAQRPEGSETLRTLVLENLSDGSVLQLWNNPQDVKNIIDVFQDLRHLFLSMRRHEEDPGHNINFHKRLWEMICKAKRLESLCLVDLDADEKPPRKIITSSQLERPLEEWQFLCVPMMRSPSRSVLPNLAFLELRQVEVMGNGLVSTLKSFRHSLRELHLDHVYLKTVYSVDSPQDVNNTLWIGLPNVPPPRNHQWVATCLRQIGMRLRVCEAAYLGYDQFVMDEEPANDANYDLADPCGLARTLEERFVEVATGVEQPRGADGSPVAYWTDTGADTESETDEDGESEAPAPGSHGPAEAGSASAWQRSIDGQFPNCNPFTLNMLHVFAESAYNGITILNRRALWDEYEDDYDEFLELYDPIPIPTFPDRYTEEDLQDDLDYGDGYGYGYGFDEFF
ncbi:hypothetical protein GGS23DRAFT_594712 [Durotheca rogersii]|uniref:uncharacterized protein n=1 Tax=Durotheca rogersii TaxID=419775 RepID=UPI002220F266|nr:uncharacterized protein GGS23DRAFT_594712 [Durotheca rogersii]KAI5865165.1 hypothetical protein GGS23DRAFT_594712 [Durotheca rogersii]